MLADAALNRRLVEPEEIDEVLRRCRTWPGYARAVRALAQVDSRAGSPLESISRLRMTSLGIPEPCLQPVIIDLRGRFLARADFWWPDLGVAGEADGRLKYENDALWAEKQRQERLEEAGITVVRWGWQEATRGGGQVMAGRLRSAFARARQLQTAGLPRLWSVREPYSGDERGKPSSPVRAGRLRASPSRSAG